METTTAVGVATTVMAALAAVLRRFCRKRKAKKKKKKVELMDMADASEEASVSDDPLL